MQTLKAYYIQSVGKNLTSSIGHRSLENVEHEDEGEEDGDGGRGEDQVRCLQDLDAGPSPQEGLQGSQECPTFTNMN